MRIRQIAAFLLLRCMYVGIQKGLEFNPTYMIGSLNNIRGEAVGFQGCWILRPAWYAQNRND
jgi:hypothetical protein